MDQQPVLQNSIDSFDLIIVGGGAVGLATAYSAAKQYPNKKVLVLEQFDFFNDQSASAGDSRQFRIQYNEREISELVLASIPLWEELQTHTSTELMKKVGCLWFGEEHFKGPEAQLSMVIQVMKELQIPFEPLNAKEIEKRFHFKNLPHDTTGFFQKNGASINVKGTLKTLYDVAKKSADISLLERQKVMGISPFNEGFKVETNNGSYYTHKLVLAPGPYINEVLEMLGMSLKISLWEMTSAYFAKSDPRTDYPTWINYQEGTAKDPGLYYGFPDTSWDHPGFIRVASNYPTKLLSNMGEYSLTPDRHVLDNISHWVSERMTGLDPTPHYTSNCVCALLAEGDDSHHMSREFILGFAPPHIPNYENIVIQATGWMFKLTPLLGKICADLAFQGKSDFDLKAFKF